MAALAIDRALAAAWGAAVLAAVARARACAAADWRVPAAAMRLDQLDRLLGLLRQLGRGLGGRLGGRRGLEGGGRGGQRRVVGGLVGQGLLGRGLGGGECVGRGLLGLRGLADRLLGRGLGRGGLAGELLGGLERGPRLVGRGRLGLLGLLELLDRRRSAWPRPARPPSAWPAPAASAAFAGRDRILERSELLRQRVGLGLGRGQGLLRLLEADGDRGGVDRQVRQPPAVLRVPDADLARPVGGDDLATRRG